MEQVSLMEQSTPSPDNDDNNMSSDTETSISEQPLVVSAVSKTSNDIRLSNRSSNPSYFVGEKRNQNATRSRGLTDNSAGKVKNSRVDQRKKKKITKASKRKTNASAVLDATSEDEAVPVPPKRSSLVWQYATRCSDLDYATCNLCDDNRRISTNNGSTSTLRQHLIKKHDKHELSAHPKKNASSTPFNFNEKKQLHNLIVNCIVKDSRIFSDFEKPGLRKVLEKAFPGYVPPSRQVVARQLKKLRQVHRQKLIDDLKLIDSLSITLDFWTNRRMKCFLVVTGHYIKSDGVDVESTILDFSIFNHQHTASDITQVLRFKLQRLGILHKIVRVTCDGARNMVNAVDGLGLNARRIWCMAHRLHLVVTNALGFWIKKKKNKDDPVDEEGETMDTIDDFKKDLSVEDMAQADDSMEIGANPDTDDAEQLIEDFCGDDDEPMDVDDAEVTDNWMEGVDETVSNITSDQEIISAVLKKCRNLTLLIKRSIILTMYFDFERKKLSIRRSLSLDVRTRWNSTYYLIDSFLALREVVERLFKSKHRLQIKQEKMDKLSNLELTSGDWIMLTQLHDLLRPFFNATKAMSGRSYPTIGFAYYLFVRLKMFLQTHSKKDSSALQRLKQLLLQKLSFYFENDDEQMDLLKIHSYFDPAGFLVLNDKEKRSVEYEIKNMVIQDTSAGSQSSPTPSSLGSNRMISSNSSNGHDKSNKSAMDTFNESIGDYVTGESVLASNGTEKVSIINDIRNYRQAVSKFTLKHKLDEFSSTQFWTTHAKNLPLLSKLMRKVLSAPASSVPSESAFSLSAFIGRKERSRLTEENLSASVFLKDKIVI